MTAGSLQRGAGLAVFLSIAALADAGPAAAAVKVCRSPQSSGFVVAPSEEEGKRKAIEAWVLKVRAAGDARFAGWPVAASRLLRCSAPKQGRVACIAVATPCAIQQAPPKKLSPRRPGVNKPIEA